MKTASIPRNLRFLAGIVVSLAASSFAGGELASEPSALPALPPFDREEAALGETLFFDMRLSGDATTACSSCHDPRRVFADGMALSDGYPSTLYFRNTPSLLNTAFKKHLYWDGRFSGGDVTSVIRDHISEAHFMQADGRLIVERLRQMPYYEKTFLQVYGDYPSYGNILKALTTYVRTLVSTDVPFDRYLEYDKSALSKSAQRGWKLFTAKAGCVRCHGGAMFTDEGFHNRGVPENPEIVRSPRRQITFRRFFKILGFEGYRSLKHDPGLYAVTKKTEDNGKFRTPSLREVARTAPYMHNGIFQTLEEAVIFEAPDLSTQERGDLIEFLKSLSGRDTPAIRPVSPTYAVSDFPVRAMPRGAPAAPKRPRRKSERRIGPLPPVTPPPDNLITPAKVKLGRMLFFDTRISGNRSNSCATCHIPEMGWGDGYDISHAYPGTQHWRNAQTLLNAAHYTKLNWDGSRTSLEDQARSAVLGNIDANGDPAMIEERLAQAPIYSALFKEIFKTHYPLFEDMIKAITTFVRSELISRKVPFDAYYSGDLNALSEDAVRGMRLFEGKAGCIRCHNGPLFSDEDYHATGVPDNSLFLKDPQKQVTLRYQLAANGVPETFYRTAHRDPGLYLVTKRERDIEKFRTQSLRELKYTAPYMHNGVLATLGDVVDFYDRGGGDALNKSPLLKPLGLRKSEKKDLIAFLEALSGEEIIIEAPELPGYPGTEHK